MKKNFLIIALILFSKLSFSQEVRTLFSNDSTKISFGGYGGSLIEVPQINNDWGLIIGGKGGFIINRKLAFGGIGKGLVSRNEFLGDNLKDNKKASLSLSYGVGGFFVEYISKLESPIHFSIPINFMAGKISVEDATSIPVEDATSNDSEIEFSTIFIIEPGINLEFNFTKYFIPALNISYRQVFGSSLVNLNNQDISGVNIGLIFKFGYF